MVFNHSTCDLEWAPYSLSCTTATVSAILCLVTIPGNLLICIAMIKDPHKELNSPFNYFVINLAIADLTVGLVTEPAFIIFHIREALKYPVVERIWLVHLLYFIACTASLFSLSALTIDRYLTITSLQKRTPNRTKIIMCLIVIWVASFSFPCLYFITGFYLFSFIFANTVIMFTLIVVSYAYIRVYLRLRTQVLRWGSLNQRQMKCRAMLFERKLTHAFLVILGFFIVCLIPSCFINYFISLCGTCDCKVIHWLRDVQFILTLINCSTNQFLYAMRMSKFRRAFVTILNLQSCTLYVLFKERRRGLVQLNHERELIEIQPLASRSCGNSVVCDGTGTGDTVESNV